VATLSEFAERGIGGEERRSMKTRIKYTEEPMGELRVIKDFLPPPDQLILKEENVKVTIALKKSSIEFFKKEAKKHQTSYQKMIREVVDWYASHYQKGV
jgi:predicted DNA binding CopG/RHH family protein